ncbi:MAG: hypothetical protein J6S67_02740 [Methanobrevibacter sp.]|nr:hypothetical protein [Methanobrevibacter sp.]
MSPNKYFSDDLEDDEELVKARADGYKAGIAEMMNNIQMVAALCYQFPVEDRLDMFLKVIDEI